MLPRRRISAGNKNEAKKTTTGASSSANSLRNLEGTASGPEALSVFQERSTQLTLQAEMMMEGIGLERGAVI